MRDHDSGMTLTFDADDLDRIIHGLLDGNRNSIILADEINRRWRTALDALAGDNYPNADGRAAAEARFDGGAFGGDERLLTHAQVYYAEGYAAGTAAAAAAVAEEPPDNFAVMAVLLRPKYFIRSTDEGWEVMADGDPSFT